MVLHFQTNSYVCGEKEFRGHKEVTVLYRPPVKLVQYQGKEVDYDGYNSIKGGIK